MSHATILMQERDQKLMEELRQKVDRYRNDDNIADYEHAKNWYRKKYNRDYVPPQVER